jgi:hypothetical protein
MIRLPHADRYGAAVLWRVPSERKGETVGVIRDYFRRTAGVVVPDERMHVFDDYDRALQSFRDIAPRVRTVLVSRRSRRGRRGHCGAEVDEIVLR